MHASTPLILRKSRMRRRARTDLCGGRSVMVVPTATVILPEIHFRVARAPETTVSGQASGPLLQHGDNPGMWLINTMALGGPRRLLRRRERDQGRADDHKNCHTYQFST